MEKSDTPLIIALHYLNEFELNIRIVQDFDALETHRTFSICE